jgi:drug/metabolite transporter (DMT)-like permease
VKRGTALAAVIISAACFGTLAILTPLAYEAGARPLPLLTWRFVLASLLLFGLVLVRGRRSVVAGRRDVARYALLAVTGYGAASICFFFALLYADASVVAVTLYTYPAMVVIAGWVFWRRPVRRGQVVAVVLTFVGIAFVLDPFGPGVSASAPGVLLGLGAAAGYTSFNLLSHRWLPGRSRLVMMAYTFGIAAVLVGVVTLLAGGSLSPASWEREVWWLLAAIVLVPTFAAVVLYLEGIRGLGPAQAALVSTLEPLFTIAFARVVLDERL